MRKLQLAGLLVAALAQCATAALVLSGGGLALIEEGGTLDAGNLAAASAGATAFAIDDISSSYVAHATPHLNDGFYGNSNSWIGRNPSSTLGKGFAGIDLGGLHSVDSIAFGRSNTGSHTDRCLGLYTLQCTTVPDPDETTPDSDWTTIGTLDYQSVGGTNFAEPARRHRYTFDPVAATGVRLVVPYVWNQDVSLATCIDEIELYNDVGTDGLCVWLDASRGVETGSGGAVTAWRDLSGNGHDATAPGAAPTLVDGELQGKPVVHFAGSQYLELPAPDDLGILSQDYEMFLVARSSAGSVQFLIGGTYEHYEIHLNGSPGARYIPNGYVSDPDASDLGASGAFTDGEAHIFAARLLGGDDYHGVVRVDGLDSTDLTDGDDRSAANGALQLGRRAGGTPYYLTGDIAEVLIYDHELTDAEREAVEQYLHSKWVVPEPASVGLVGAGLLVLLRRRRARR